MSGPDIDAGWRLSWLAALQILPHDVCFVGIGAPCQAAMLARRTHAPHATLVFESGVIGANPDRMPLSTGSPSVARGATTIGSMLDVFSWLQRGGITLGMLSGAEVDRNGNLNSTVIGSYGQPKVRLPGSGGAHDIAMLAQRVVILMPHEPKRFVERVDFATSPGHPRPRSHRLGAGPAAVVTTRALFLFVKGEMTLAAHFDDITADQAVAGIPWEVPRLSRVGRIPVPRGDALALAQHVEEAA